MSAETGNTAVAADRGARALAGDGKIKAAIVGATGYVGSELIRLLALHPHVTIHGLVGRERKGDPIAHIHPHLATRDLEVWDHVPEDAEVVFLALPHGAVASRVQEFLDRGQTVIDLGPDFRFRDPADYPAWYHFDHPAARAAAVRRLRPAGAASRGAGGPGHEARRDHRRARLLRHHDDPEPRPARARRPHRRCRRRREERCLRRRS